MALEIAKTKWNQTHNYWAIRRILGLETAKKWVRVELVLYKDKATSDADRTDYPSDNVYNFTLSASTFPLDSVDLKVVDKDVETLIYEKIKALGVLEEIDGDIDFSTALDV